MKKLVEEIRVDNLRRLVKEYGGVHPIAEKLGKDDSQVSQWLNRSPNSGTGKPRNISSKSARFIEDTFKKTLGWMDTPEKTMFEPQTFTAVNDLVETDVALSKPENTLRMSDLTLIETGLTVKFRLASEDQRNAMIEAIERIYAGQFPSWQPANAAAQLDHKTQTE